MTETSPWQLAVEVHPPNWRFPASPVWIAGWIRPKTDRVVTDVRARIDQRVILGLSGLPHPAFPAISGQPLAGFSFLLAPHSGATQLCLEARDSSGEWTEFFRTAITVAPDAPPAPALPDLRLSFPRLVTALVRQRMLSPERSWAALADELMASFVAESLNAYPNLPFVGALEEPQAAGRFRYGVIPVTGWLSHGQAAITRLTAIIDPLPPMALPYGPARHDIARTFPSLASRPGSAFAGEVAVPDGGAEPVLLKIFAELANGEQHLTFAQRFTPQFHRGPGEMPPQVPGATFIRAARALHHAAGHYALSRRGLILAAWNFWSAYRAAPGYRPAPAFREKSLFHRPDAAPTAATVTTVNEPATREIAPADDMLVREHTQYFAIGREALALVQAACTLAGCARVEAILDLPCGHGRVARWLRAAYPAAKLAVSDIQEPGVNFCRERLGATGVVATVDGRHWAALPGPFDIIWCGSLLTHLGRDQWVSHLQRFAERLTPHGVLVFTTHGLVALDKLQTGEKDYGLPPAEIARLCADAVASGFGYVDYPDAPGYGISVSQTAWIRELVARETGLRVAAIHESAWDQHQDVVVCTPRM